MRRVATVTGSQDCCKTTGTPGREELAGSPHNTQRQGRRTSAVHTQAAYAGSRGTPAETVPSAAWLDEAECPPSEPRSPVDREDLASDEPGLARCEEGHGIGDLVRRTPAAAGHHTGNPLDGIRSIPKLLGRSGGLDRPWSDRIDADLVLRPFHRECLRHGHDTRLGGCRVDRACASGPDVVREDRHDGATFASLDHVTTDRPRTVEAPVQHDTDHRIPSVR